MRYRSILSQWALLTTFSQFALTLPNFRKPWQEVSSLPTFPRWTLNKFYPNTWDPDKEILRTSPPASLGLTEVNVVPTKLLEEREVSTISNTASAAPTHVPLPIKPRITPATSVAGVLLICLGTAYSLIGIKIHWILVPVGVFFLIDIAVAVLLTYVAKPPISDGIQGAYFGAIFGAGLLLGSTSWLFKEITEGLVCLLGGYCFSMWILVLRSGSSIHTSGARAIFIVVISVAAYALWFSRYTRNYGLIACSSFAGATALSLGIDCFSKAGMKEFWLYIWALNDKIFPLGTNTYPLTRGLRIEAAVIILAAIAGSMSQMRLWLVLKEQRTDEEAGFLHMLRDPRPRGKASTPKPRHNQLQRFASWRMLLGSRRQRRNRRFPLDVEEPFENRVPGRTETSQLSRSVAEELEMRFFSAFTLPPLGDSLRGVTPSKPSRLASEDETVVLDQPELNIEEQGGGSFTTVPHQTASQDISVVPPANRHAKGNASVSSFGGIVKRKPLPPNASRSTEQLIRPSPYTQSTEDGGQDAHSVYVTPESDRQEFVKPSISENSVERDSGASVQPESEGNKKSGSPESVDIASEQLSDDTAGSGADIVSIKRPKLASSRNYLLREPHKRLSRDSNELPARHISPSGETETAGPVREDEVREVSSSGTEVQEDVNQSQPPSIPQKSRHRSTPFSSELMRTSIDENSEADFDSLSGSHSSLSARLISPQSPQPSNGRKRHTLSTLQESTISASERLQRLRDNSSSRYSSTDSITSFAARSDPSEDRSLRLGSEESNWNPLSQEADDTNMSWRRSSTGLKYIQPRLYNPVEQGPIMTPRAGRRSFTDPERRAEMLATWRQSVRQEAAIKNAPYETADSRRVEMLMDKHHDRLNQLQKEAANIRREQAYDQMMRSKDGQEAHREAMQKMQASANRQLRRE